MRENGGIWERIFILDYFSTDWEDLLKIDEPHVDNSTQMYLEKINILLDTYAALKKMISKSWDLSLNLG